LDPALPPVQTDPSQIQQVLMNLLLNAAEAIGERSGLIRLRTGEERIAAERMNTEFAAWPVQPGRFLFIEVEDTGCGMNEETKARVFDPFFTTKFQGRGLGLAAVAGIVRGHKGAITVQTAPGAGATFRVWLPVSTSAAEEPPPLARTPEAAPPAGEGTVLVVDDERLVREVARKALERSGYHVLSAESGRAAVDTLRTHGEIEAVVLDLSMPGMSGEETLENLRAIRPDLKVIISSGYNEAEALRIFGGQRIAGFLQKPYSVQDLARKLQEALKSSEAADRR
jgi:CheY-like chemotaxis protein